MKKQAAIRGLCLLALVVSGAALTHAQTSGSVTASLKLSHINDDSAFDGCGCALYLTAADEQKHRAVFLSDLEEKAVLGLGGKDFKLRLSAASKETNAAPKIGDRDWKLYNSDNFKVRIDYTVTKVCAPQDESCEVTYYRAVITIIRGQRKTSFKTGGLCGC